MSELVQIGLRRRVMLVNFEVAPATVKNLILTLAYYMLLQLTKSLGCAAAAEKWTADNHVTLALLYVRKSVLELKYLIAMAALYSNLVDDVIEVTVLVFCVKQTLALAAFRTTLVKPLFYAVTMENLFAVAALH